MFSKEKNDKGSWESLAYPVNLPFLNRLLFYNEMVISISYLVLPGFFKYGCRRIFRVPLEVLHGLGLPQALAQSPPDVSRCDEDWRLAGVGAVDAHLEHQASVSWYLAWAIYRHGVNIYEANIWFWCVLWRNIEIFDEILPTFFAWLCRYFC